jgi:uncharacterized delta-60 repeat protein
VCISSGGEDNNQQQEKKDGLMKRNPPRCFTGLLSTIALFAASMAGAQPYCVLDGDFNPGGSFNTGATIMAVGVQSDGKVVCGGYFTYYGNYANGYPFTVNNLVRFNDDGTVDTTFNPAPNHIVRAILVQPDDKIIIAGYFTQVSGLTQTYISRLTTGGYPDYIGFQAPAPNNHVYALGRLSDGKIVVGGAFTTMGGASYARVACLNTNGTIISSFNPGVSGSSGAPAVWAIAVYGVGTPSADKIMIGGDFNSVAGLTRVNAARLNSCGCLDPSFDMGTSVLNGPIYALATDSGDFGCGSECCEKVYIGGAFTNLDQPQRDYFARLANAGYPDHNVLGTYVENVVNSIRVQTDHRVIVGGAFSGGVVRLAPSSDLLGTDGDWGNCTPRGANGTVNAIALTGGRIYVGGAFGQFEGMARPRIARLLTSPPD